MDNEQLKHDIALRFKSLCRYCMYDILADHAILRLFIGIIRKLSNDKPEWYITMAGPFLWKYRKQIESHDFNFFINHDFESQKRDWHEMTGGYGPPLADSVLNSVKETLRQYRDENPDLVITTAKAMLKLYSQYRLACSASV